MEKSKKWKIKKKLRNFKIFFEYQVQKKFRNDFVAKFSKKLKYF